MASKSEVFFITEIAYAPIAFSLSPRFQNLRFRLKSPGFLNKISVNKDIPNWFLPELNQITIAAI